MSLTQEGRKLTHLKGGNISFSRTPPSVNNMADGDIVFSIGTFSTTVGSVLGLYVKFMGKLWFTEMKDVESSAGSGAGNLTFKSGSSSTLTATQDAWLRVKVADDTSNYFIPAFTDDIAP